MLEVVCYHHIKDRPRKNSAYTHLTLEEFDYQLDFFQETGTIVNPKALPHLPPNSNKRQYVLSFDDGTLEHYSLVMPALKSRGLSAVFFINSLPFREKRLLNVHRIQFLLQHYPVIQLSELFEKLCHKAWINQDRYDQIIGSTYPFTNQDQQVVQLKSIINFCMTPSHQTAILQAMFDALQIDEQNAWNAWYMKEHQIKDMISSGMCIGAHGHSHYVLSGLSADKQCREIDQSIDFIRQHHAGEPTFFCYPYGYPFSYNQHTIKCLQKHHVDFSFTTVNQSVTYKQFCGNALELPRIDCIFYPTQKSVDEANVA